MTRTPLASVNSVGASELRAVVGVRTALATHDGSTMGPLGMRLEKSSLAAASLLLELPRGGFAFGRKCPTTVGCLRYVRAAASKSSDVRAANRLSSAPIFSPTMPYV